jgi:2-deoxy-D-gluconate 3-dehydrogenase
VSGSVSDGDLFRLDGSTAVVTGGAMGIGFGMASAFCSAGADVVIADVDEDAGRAACAALPSGERCGSAVFAHTDVRDPDAGEAIVARGNEAFGDIDVLVNNAGIFPLADIGALTSDLFDSVFDLNVRGTLLVSQAVSAAMRDQGRGGSIINIGSMDAFKPSMPGLVTYGASKGAVITLTKHLALALAPDQIRVNAIVPGGITTEGSARMSAGTDMTDEERDAMIAGFAARVPMRRLGEAGDLGGPAVFLASAAAGYVTGAVLLVDGGLILAS